MADINQKKKKNELFYASEAAKCLKEDWNIFEKYDEENYPDFVVEHENICFGLEVTQYFRDFGEFRKGSAVKAHEVKNNTRLIDLASEYYEISDIPLMVRFYGIFFTDESIPNKLAELAKIINQGDRAEYIFKNGLKAYVQRLSDEFTHYNRWQLLNDRGGWVHRIPKENIQIIVQNKSKKLDKYKTYVENVSLLIYLDPIFNSGQCVYEGDDIDTCGFKNVYFMKRPDFIRVF